MSLSIVIPTHASGRSGRQRRLKRIVALLESLEKQGSHSFLEVIVVPNFPDPRLDECISRFGPLMRYRANSVRGANAARNTGAMESRGDVILFLDDDCLVEDPDFLIRHALLHQEHPHIAAIGGGYRLPERSSRLARSYHVQQMDWLLRSPRPSFRADWLFGGNLSIKRAVLREHPFNEELIYGGTETELILRLASHGLETRYFEGLAVTHRADPFSISSYMEKGFAQGRGASFIGESGFRARALLRSRHVPSRDWRTVLFRAAFDAGYRRKPEPPFIRSVTVASLVCFLDFYFLRRRKERILDFLNRIRSSSAIDIPKSDRKTSRRPHISLRTHNSSE